MAVNPNAYSGQRTYSRDVTRLMRRINVLEARLNIIHGAPFGAWDFDIYEGRIYVLVTTPGGVTEDPAGRGIARMYVYDMAGLLIDDWALPVNFVYPADGKSPGLVTPPKNILDILLTPCHEVQPRFCIGENKIFMAGTATRDLKPDKVTGEGFSRRTLTHTYDVGAMFSMDLNGSGFTKSGDWPRLDDIDEALDADKLGRMKAPCFGARGWGYPLNEHRTNPSDISAAYAVGPRFMQLQFLDGRVWGACASFGYGVNAGIGSVTGIVDYATPVTQANASSLCYTSADFTEPGWVQHSEYEGYENASGDIRLAGIYVGIAANSALAVHENRLYFDASDGSSPITNFTGHFFGSVDVTEHASGQADLVHALFPRTGTGGSGSPYPRHPHKLYATDGTYLFGWHAPEGAAAERLKRYDLESGAHLDTWAVDDGIGEVIQMRVKDGVLWLLMLTGADEGFQPKVESRDPATMAVLSFFYIGTPISQREWSAPTPTGLVSLGTPDNGVTVPEDEKLVEVEAYKAGTLITDMRSALVGIAPFFLAPTGNRLHLNGLDDDENLYVIAMGDRTKYGATGGPRLTWTRPTLDDLTVTSRVNLLDFAGRVEEDATYVCIRDHLAAGVNKPAEGDEWETCWKAIAFDETAGAWADGGEYHVHKTYDIDIGEIDECLTILEGSPLASAPTGGT